MTLNGIIFKTKGCEVYFKETKYYDGKRAIQVIVNDATCPEVYGTLSVNLPDVTLAEDEICVKDWSENRQLAADAFATGWFEDTGKAVQSGYVTVPIWRIKIK